MSSWERTAMQVLSSTPSPQTSELPPSAPGPAASTSAPQRLGVPSNGAVIARAAQSDPAAATLAGATPSATIARVGAGSGSGGGGDDGYEQFLDRLRRDLLREREQIGDLLGETPW
jgi:hypothetical protein